MRFGFTVSFSSHWRSQAHFISLFLLTSLVAFMGGCASTLELSSNWSKNDVTIDGKASDWEGALSYISNSNVSVGIRNDENYVYVCLVTAERQTQAQILGLGLTVWLDPKGNGNKSFGVNFPIARQGQGRRVLLRDAATEGPEMEEMFEQLQRELDIVGPNKEDRHRLTMVQAGGISGKLGRSQGSLIYELKIPLQKSAAHPYAVGAMSGTAISVGFETGEFSPDDVRRGTPSGAGAGVGQRPGGRSGRGASGGEINIGGPDRPQAFKLWTKVQLASNTSSTSGA